MIPRPLNTYKRSLTEKKRLPSVVKSASNELRKRRRQRPRRRRRRMARTKRKRRRKMATRTRNPSKKRSASLQLGWVHLSQMMMTWSPLTRRSLTTNLTKRSIRRFLCTKETVRPRTSRTSPLTLTYFLLLSVTTLEIDAIVNAANEECKGGGGSTPRPPPTLICTNNWPLCLTLCSWWSDSQCRWTDTFWRMCPPQGLSHRSDQSHPWPQLAFTICIPHRRPHGTRDTPFTFLAHWFLPVLSLGPKWGIAVA